MKDFSQHGEQQHILDFFKDLPRGRFLDLGAFDGVTISNTRALAELGWDGVCVEASPYAFIKLLGNTKSLPNVKCILGAVVPEGSAVPIFNECESHPFGSVGPSEVSNCFQKTQAFELVTSRYHIGRFSPQDIGAAFGYNFDFISVDIEGLDLDVLKDMYCLCVRTKLICVEVSIPFAGFDNDYYVKFMEVLNKFGFTRIIARLPDEKNTINLLIAR